MSQGPQLVDLSRPMAIHVIGVGGAGMRAIATVLAAMGHTVSGSDLKAAPGFERLRAEGIAVVVGHDAANIGEASLVTRSTAVPDSNPEVVAALEQGVPVVSRAQMLAAITRIRRTVAVAGTHGKTTTSSMLAVILRVAELSPSFIIGGELNETGSGAVWADGDGWFVVEADESDGTFLELDRAAAIVTSVEPDHLSYYGTEAHLEEAFASFVDGVAGPTVLCLDDPGAAALATADGVISYGVDAGADWVISEPHSERASASFRLAGPEDLGTFKLAAPGLHNIRNAAAAVVMALQLGAPADAARAALARYGGVARRFHFRGEHGGVTYVDDYAHLPGEVEAALEAAGAGGWDRVVCVFQPHRYTRTAALATSFGDRFGGADLVVVTDVYGAGEVPMPGVSGKLVADAILDARPGTALAYLPHRDDLHRYLLDRLRPGDLCLTLGAGDLTTLPDELVLGRSA